MSDASILRRKLAIQAKLESLEKESASLKRKNEPPMIILNSLGILVIAYLSIVLEVLIIQFIRTKRVRRLKTNWEEEEISEFRFCNSCGNTLPCEDFSQSQFYYKKASIRRCIICADSNNNGKDSRPFLSDAQAYLDRKRSERRVKMEAKQKERAAARKKKEEERAAARKREEEERKAAREKEERENRIREEQRRIREEKIRNRLLEKRESKLSSWKNDKAWFLNRNFQYEIELEMVEDETRRYEIERYIENNKAKIRELSLLILDNTY